MDPPTAMGTAAEAAFLFLFGAFFARIVIAGLLELGNDSEGVRLAIGWGFFLISGIVDSLIHIGGTLLQMGTPQPLTSPGVLLTLATVVGGFTGMMAGLYRIYDWKGLGILQLLGDVSWGLAGSTTGALVALVNVFFGSHAPDDRSGAHRYTDGFHLKEDFSFTQGNVISDLPDARLADGQPTPLYRHERLHVFQNRMFGPIFMLTYLGWMAVWIVPSLIACGVRWTWSFIEGWCYRSNPWEIWAYRVQRKASNQTEEVFFRGGGDWARFVFSETVGAILAVPFFLLVLPLIALIAVAAW